ncbi:oligopeptide ABC transporter substrate-binding protein OppA [Mesoplasma florum]|uniref:oligopeptide ABC transporter substrate-binding protein OppA n=1 Tax=Mesoplasma florum TaxID=2151 RepID=UPI000D04334E|nr:oligopeptide ABC transporter substrate-binding protein OppA [Mesoplasma florum]AVN58711.1 hypothetical protein CG009_00455 [Mesoplasma florum]
MKKLLSIIAASTLVATTGSTLVSCGMTPSKLMARKVSTTEYKGFMKSAINTWSPGSTMQNSDSIILENLYDGLLTPNAHDEIEGQMADWWGHNEDGTEYYFHLRDKETKSDDGRVTGIPSWTITKNGAITGTQKVSPLDFFNAFRFTFNPNSSADGAAPTNGLFKNGTKLSSILSTVAEYDSLVNNGKNFDRTTQQGGASNIGQEAISTRNYDIAIMLINLWTGTKEGQAKIDALYKAKITPILDNGEIVGYKRTPEFDNLINDISYYTFENNFQQLISKSSQEGGMMAVSLSKNGLGTTVENSGADPQMYNIRYTLEDASTSFFTSAAGYGSLKPLPYYAVSYSDRENRSWYNFSKKYQPGINEMWFSGAFYLKSYKASSNAVLLKNPNYYQADRTYIEKATYTLANSQSVDSNRLWFEGGDASEVVISPNDASGFKKYVGEDYNIEEQKFAFEGTHAASVPSQYTFTTFYNYGRVNASNKISASSQALAQKSVRLYLNYFMQRTQLPAYVAGELDNKYNTKEALAWDKKNGVKTRSSTLLRNVFTIPKLAENATTETVEEVRGVKSNDYTVQNVGKDYNEMYGLKNTEFNNSEDTALNDDTSDTRLSILEKNITVEHDDEKLRDFYNEQFGSLIDGNDSFYQNDLMVLGMFLDKDGNVIPEYQDQLNAFANLAYKSVVDREQKNMTLDLENEHKKAKILGEVVSTDLFNKNIISDKNQTIELEWLLNGISKLTTNERVDYIVAAFNDSVNNTGPITLKTKVSSDDASFLQLAKAGDYDIFVSGWGPDYTDPYNFLHTLIYGGEYDSYTKLTKVVKVDSTKKSESSLKDAISKAPTLMMNKGYEAYTSIYQDLMDSVSKYTGIVEDAKGEGDFTERLNKLSTAETYALYDVGFTAPLYNKNPMKQIQLSYLDPFTKSSFIAGSSNLRLFGVKMVQSLWTKEDFLNAEIEFKKGSAETTKAEYKKLYVYNENSDKNVLVTKSGIPTQ